MSPGAHTERASEDRVEYELLRRGWETASGLFSAETGIHTGTLWDFIGRTQIKRWNKLIELHGGDPDVVRQEDRPG
jgi:type I restriction enzyme, R subunit